MPHPQASGTAATRAAKGTTMNSSSAICSIERLLSPPSVAEEGAGSVADGRPSSSTSGLVAIGESPVR